MTVPSTELASVADACPEPAYQCPSCGTLHASSIQTCPPVKQLCPLCGKPGTSWGTFGGFQHD
jgi:hypothetical protein